MTPVCSAKGPWEEGGDGGQGGSCSARRSGSKSCPPSVWSPSYGTPLPLLIPSPRWWTRDPQRCHWGSSARHLRFVGVPNLLWFPTLCLCCCAAFLWCFCGGFVVVLWCFCGAFVVVLPMSFVSGSVSDSPLKRQRACLNTLSRTWCRSRLL